MRLAQLLDLARAYELPVNLNGTKQRVMPIIQAAAEEGRFRHPPKHPYYLSRAYYSSDDVKDAKGKMGDPESGAIDPSRIPTQLKPWHGALPEKETVSRETIPAPKQSKADSPDPDGMLPHRTRGERRDAWEDVKDRAKELGIRIQGKTPQGLRRAIAYHEKKLAAKEAEDAGKIDSEPAEPVETAA